MAASAVGNKQHEVTPMRTDELLQKLADISEASRKGLKVQNLLRLMSQPELWKMAYAEIQANKGALTPGTDENMLDGFSIERVKRLAAAVREGKYRPKPVRRTYIPKPNGKKRALGIPSSDDKLAQEAMRILLESVYEPIFSDHSHGFRPGRSCHTALAQVKTGWNGTKWIIDVDVKGFFDNIDHQVLMGCLERKIGDKRLLKLIKGFMEAGYVEDWTYHETYTGIPQGRVISPLLANVYLHELDTFVTGLGEVYNTRQKFRRWNPEYQALRYQIHKRRKQVDKLKKVKGSDDEISRLRAEIKALLAQGRTMPTQDPQDPGFKRIRYVRYADDFLVGVIGSKEDAQHILGQIKRYLTEMLKLEVNEDKTRITRMKEGVNFLSYDITVHTVDKVVKGIRHGRMTETRVTREVVKLRVPTRKLEQFCHHRKYGDWFKNKGETRMIMSHLSVPEIISAYNSELRGLANYYMLAGNMKAAVGRLMWIAHDSLLRTISAKLRMTKMALINRMRTSDDEWVWKETAPSGKELSCRVFKLKHLSPPKGYKAVKELAKQTPDPDKIIQARSFANATTTRVQRLDARKCEACGVEKPCEVHHVKRLQNVKDKKSKTLWDYMVIARRRKTLVLCPECHDALHSGRLPDARHALVESRVQ
jgi:group II intron reverse transcriptase/maturase